MNQKQQKLLLKGKEFAKEWISYRQKEEGVNVGRRYGSRDMDGRVSAVGSTR